MAEISKEINKLKYQIQLLANAIDSERYPIEVLVIELDWDRDDLDAAHDIFEEYDKKIKKGEEVNWVKFELDIKNKFNIGYQTVKSIILAFYENHQWIDVCKGYAKQHDVVEFKEIIFGKGVV